MSMQFFEITDRIPEDPARSSNGGDYYFGRTVAVKNGQPFAVRFWTSADFDYCPRCGHFRQHEYECFRTPTADDFSGWEAGEMLDGEDHERAMSRLESGGFAVWK